MAKRFIKSPIKSQTRREWLRRYDDGESPPQIAKADSRDIRTVRKHIEREQQERERKDARATVLRSALEWHYKDLCTFAKELQAEVAKENGLLATPESSRICAALHEHVPRSSIWRNLDRLRRIREEIAQLTSKIEKLFLERIGTKPPIALAVSAGETGLYPDGLVPAVSFHFRAVAQGQQGFCRTDPKYETLDEKTTLLRLGAYNLGGIPNGSVTSVWKWVRDLLEEVTMWDEQREMRRLSKELHRVQEMLDDELAVLVLRRVVPGRCRYCPI